MKQIYKMVKTLVERRNQCFVEEADERSLFTEKEASCLERKRKLLQNRKAEIVKSSVNGQINSVQRVDDQIIVSYALHFQQLIKQKRKFYIEEFIEQRKALFSGEELVEDREVTWKNEETEVIEVIHPETGEERSARFSYDRRAAVNYAERWWNDYNPQFKKFNDNCTNFISQCLHAGGAPMTGFSNRSKGWWYQNNNWSFSWSVAHSFRWYLSGAQSGLRGIEMESARDLSLGDVICYDFDGDGRWQHSTIVVAKDDNGEPLVNAQTTNSRMRYWAYEDSTAYTPNIKYKFFRIADGQ